MTDSDTRTKLPNRLSVMVVIGLVALPAAPSSAQEVVTAVEPVVIVGQTPLPGTEQPITQLPVPVKVLRAAELSAAGTATVADALYERIGSVHINGNQGNPFQPDFNYRGFTASPLLGTPQGVAVFVDGVRANQPFGDVVGWDLIPRRAIASATLLPGANPLFGLNALGGALALETKNGREINGVSARAEYGGGGRRTGDIEAGGVFADRGEWYGLATYTRERGWRDHSPSALGQVFGKLGYRFGDTRLRLSVTHAESDLTGNGLQDFASLQRQWTSVYTSPDNTTQRATQATLQLEHSFSDESSVSGNLYSRRVRASSVNGDVNPTALTQSLYQPGAAERAALSAAGYNGFPLSGASAANTAFPFWRCIGQSLINSEPAEKCSGLLTSTTTVQSSVGGSLQLNLRGDWGGYKHQIATGAVAESSQIGYQQGTQLGYINPDHTVTPVAAFGDGRTGGNVDGVPYDSRIALAGRVRTVSLFATDTVTIRNNLFLTAAARYNDVSVHNKDLIRPSPDPATLDGNHKFRRVNPSLGLSWSPASALNFFANISESSRAPTAVELGCANPDLPCRVVNSLTGDPPLRQVISRNIELGVRGRIAAADWHANLFRADNRDDILFVAAPQTGFGYFRNFGKTRRQGLELGLDAKHTVWGYGVAYTLLDATYRSAERIGSGGNSQNDSALAGTPGVDGDIAILPGNRLPQIPRHLLKIYAQYAPSSTWSFNASAQAQSSMLAVGNENGLHQPDGKYYLGSGRVPGFAVVNLGARYVPFSGASLGLRVTNLFDRRYASTGQLGTMAFDPQGHIQARQYGRNADGSYSVQSTTFLAPGAPRQFWAEFQYAF